MPKPAALQTYSTDAFRQTFVELPAGGPALFQPAWDQLFVLRLEELLPHVRLPIPPSRETNHKLLVLTAGELEVAIGHGTYRAGAGQVLLIPSGQLFSYHQHRGPVSGYVCLFEEEFIRLRAGQLGQQFPLLGPHATFLLTPGPEALADCVALLARMQREYRTTARPDRDLLGAYLLALLGEVQRVFQQAAPPPGQSGAEALTARFRVLLAAHYASRHLVTEYAEQLCVTPNHLTKAVKAVTGQTPSDWISAVLVTEAKVLLFQSTLAVGQVADALGFADASYFSRLFRQKAGVSPQEFRRRLE